MKCLYRPVVNRSLRTLLKPLSPLLPVAFQFPVTGTITVAIPGEDVQVVLAGNPTCYQTKVLFWQGFEGFEYNLTRIFKELVKQSRVFFDVGANIGYYTVLAGVINPAVRIFSFEPLPAAFRFLTKNIVLNGCAQVCAEQIALSNEAGTAQFFASRNPKFTYIRDHLSSTGGLDRRQATRTSLVEEYTVQTLTLDAYVARHEIGPIDLLKLDTEASEHLVLAGADRVLREHRPIILCEVLPGKIERDLTQVFDRYGYTLLRAERDGLVPLTHLHHTADDVNDHIMVPSEALSQVARFMKPD